MEATKGGGGGGSAGGATNKNLKRKTYFNRREKCPENKKIKDNQQMRTNAATAAATSAPVKQINNKRKHFARFNERGGGTKGFMECGQKGFLITCNFHEKDCASECYNLLCDYAEKFGSNINNNKDKDVHNNKEGEKDEVVQVLKQIENTDSITTDIETNKSISEENLTIQKSNIDKNLNEEQSKIEPVEDQDQEEEEEEEEEDVTKILSKIVMDMKRKCNNNNNTTTTSNFQQVETNITNCIFIKMLNGTGHTDPVKFGLAIIDDIDKMKIQRTRYTARFIPIEIVCKANMDDIKKAVNKLIDKYFLNAESTTYSIILNRRYNNSIDRTVIIRELAELISGRSIASHKVDLTNPKLSLIVEITKGLCCLSVLPDYYKLCKYNLHEIVNRTINSSSGKNSVVALVKDDVNNIDGVSDVIGESKV